eukprot:4884464-Lingulodinium_polyedra.AAC.1
MGSSCCNVANENFQAASNHGADMSRRGGQLLQVATSTSNARRGRIAVAPRHATWMTTLAEHTLNC